MTMEEYIVGRCMELEALNNALKKDNEDLKEQADGLSKALDIASEDAKELDKEIKECLFEHCGITNTDEDIRINSTLHITKEHTPNLYRIFLDVYNNGLCNQSKE